MSGVKGKSGNRHSPGQFKNGHKYYGRKNIIPMIKGSIEYKKYHTEKHREWEKRNPEKVYVHKQNMRVMRMGAIGKFTKEDWENKKIEYNYRCAICGITENDLLNNFGTKLTIDHIIPLSKGGTNWIENIQPLCKHCNCSKGNRYIM